MHPEQRSVHQALRVLVPEFGGEKDVRLDGPFEFAVGRLDQEIHAADAGRHFADQVIEQAGGAVASESRDPCDVRPPAPQADRDGVHVARADFDASERVGFVPAIRREALENPDQSLRQGVFDIPFPESLREVPEHETRPFVRLLVGCLLAKRADQGFLQFPGQD